MSFFFCFGRSAILGAVVVVLLSSCSSNPMRHRLAQNFFFNCTLGLIEEGVSPIEADQICRSAHASEIQELHIRSEKNRVMAQEAREAAQRLSDSASRKEGRTPASRIHEDK